MRKIFIAICVILGMMQANATTNSAKHKRKTQHKKSAHAKPTYMTGIASFYGGDDNFDGKKMANGKIFHANNPNLAATHSNLPLGTKLKVTNLKNQRTIYVEVADRMAEPNRIIDLSHSGAKRLGMHNRGIARVQLNIISNKEYEAKKHTVEVMDGDDAKPH